MEDSGEKVALSTKHRTKTPDNTRKIQACGKLLSPFTKETKVALKTFMRNGMEEWDNGMFD
jgi:hypothetical protein